VRNFSYNGQNGLVGILTPSVEQEYVSARFRELYDFAPTGYVSFDRSGRIAEVNLTAAQLFGIPRDHLIGMPFAVFVRREDTPLFLHHLLRCRSSDTRVETELRLKDTKRQIIYAQLVSTPVVESPVDGYKLFQTCIVDLTKRKLAEEALLEKETELELIITRTPFMLTRCTSDLRYQYVSRAYAEMLGRKPEEIAGKPMVEIMGKKALATIAPHIERVLSGETVSYEMMVPFKDAGPHFLSLTYVPDKNEWGKVIGWIASMVDVGERKKAEDRFRVAVEGSPSAMIMVDQTGRMTLVNSQAERLFGYARKELLGKPVEDLMPERFRRQLFTVPKARTSGKTSELFALRKDGTEVQVEVRLNPIRMDGQRFVLASIVDISERKKAEEHIAANFKAITLLHELGGICARPANSVQHCLRKIVETAMKIIGGDKGNLQIVDPNSGTLEIAAHSGFQKPFLKFFRNINADRASACAVALKQAKYTIVEDVTQSDIFRDKLSLHKLLAAGVRAVHSVPLQSTAGNLVGILSVHFSTPHRPCPREIGFMDLLARQAADYLERKQAERTLRNATQQQAALYQLAQRWQNAESLHDVYTAALDAITSALSCDRASILLHDDQQVTRFVAWRGLSSTYRKAVEGHSPWRSGVKNPKPMYIADMRTADLSNSLKRTMRHEGIRSAAFIPLVVEGKLTGKFMMYYRAARSFTDAELDLAMTIGRQLAQAIQHQKDEEALRESEARIRATVEQATAGVFRTDVNGRVLFVNQKFCQMLGYTASELVGKTELDLTHLEDVERTMIRLVKLIRNGASFEIEKRYVRKDGSILWADVSVGGVRAAGRKTRSTVAVVVDITARKEAEAALEKSKELLEERVKNRTRELNAANKELKNEIQRRKGLEGEILSVSDREQQRLGQELHDGLCQHLTAVAFMARSMAVRLRDHRVIDAADLDKVAELVNKAATDTRNLSRALHRVDVDAASLVRALGDLADREIWRTPCRLHLRPSFHIEDDAAAAHLYRIAREAIINANKHAHARQIVVRLERSRNEMVLRVIDDGVGFPKEIQPQQGLGYHIMKYRAQLMGGRLEIDSPKTGGTCVSCYFPVETSPMGNVGDRHNPPKNSSVPVAGDLTFAASGAPGSGEWVEGD
jgi:PAS domain S-box-containing protein